VLADIESPELDQQVMQAPAGVAQARQQLGQANAGVGDARAKRDLARVTAQRYRTLLAQDSIARQVVDQGEQALQSAQATLDSSQASVAAAEENVRATEAGLRRMLALQEFEKVRAPFDGVVTMRNVDVGALISNAGASLASGSATASASASTSASAAGAPSSPSAAPGSNGTPSGNEGTELFRIAQIDRMRVLVNVPQTSAPAVALNAPVTVHVQEFGDRFTGTIVRTASALDPMTRTLLTEVQLANPERKLMPGMYAQVQFDASRSNPPLLVPGKR
jgi:multidrug efflux pump subunit AcrA (membrane-fusion protein)